MLGTVRPSVPMGLEPSTTPLWESQISRDFKPHLQFPFSVWYFLALVFFYYSRLSHQNISPYFLSTFVILRKMTILFVMSVCPAVRMEQLGSLCTEFLKTSYGCVSLALPAVWTLLYEITRFSMKWVFQVWNGSPLDVVIVLVSFCSLSEDRPLFDKANSYWVE
jgi:hypothetical protein